MALPTIAHPFGVVADPEYGTTPSGKNFAKIRLGASARKYNDQSREWETTASFYVQATAWEQDAEKIRNLGIKQGDQVYAEGQMVTESWEKDGQKQSKTAMRLRSIRRFEKSQNAQSNGNSNFNSNNGGVAPQQSAPQQTQGNWGQSQGAPQQSAPSSDPWGNSNTGPAF